MKKTTLLILMLFITTLSFAQVLNEPANWPNSTWTITGTYSTNGANFEANPTVDSNFAYDDNQNGFGLMSQIAAESPVIDLTPTFNAGEFWITVEAMYVYNEQTLDDLGFQYWDADAATWVNWGPFINADTPGVGIDNFCNSPTQQFVSEILDIASFTPTQLSGFKYRIYFNDNGGWVKGFCFSSPTIYSDGPPACPDFDISEIAVGTITPTSVDITWAAGGSETNWEVVVQPAGTGTPTLGVGIPVSPTPATTVPGLNPNSAYEIYIISDCGGGDYSSWIGPVTFNTPQLPPPAPDGVTCPTSSFIFTEDFDEPGFWTGVINNGNSGTWEIPDGSTSTGTGANTAYSGNNYMNFEASGASGVTAAIVSPAIDLNGATGEIELSFYMHAYGAGMGTLNVGVSTSPTGPFNNEFNWVGQYQTSGAQPWVPVGIDLTAYANQIIYLEFSQTAMFGGAFGSGDMSIDYLRVEACGDFCIAPSVFTLDDITDTTADISWTPNNGETSWYYVVQPAGTGTPTGTGTQITGTPTLNLTGLDPDTDYELYVMSDCGSGFNSIWSNPFSFTTLIQTEFIVDCTVGPTVVNYCYGNNDTTTFTFTAIDGLTPIGIFFEAGTMQAGSDQVTVTDANNVVLYSGSGTGGNLTGLEFQATTTTVTVSISSDGSNSCVGGQQSSPLEIRAYCITCFNHDAEFGIMTQCDSDNGIFQFSTEVVITDMGDATSLTITDNQGTAPMDVTAVGTYEYGLYDNGVGVVLTVTNTNDANCSVSSSSLTQLECPPANSDLCTTIDAGDDQTLDCSIGVSEVQLDADFFVMGTSTSAYQLSSVSCVPQVNPGTPTNITVDDVYSSAVNIGFDFCFFGNTYSQLVIGANGLITFDLSQAGAFCPWNFDESLPDPALPTNAIFGVYHDINPSVCGNIEYILSGTAPNRTFTINFNDVCQFSCTSIQSTSQIVLYEANNSVEINIIDKPTCAGWNDGNALAGMQNIDGTIAYFPPGRNTGPWSAQNESWRYVPAGPANYTFEWFEGTTSLGNNPEITVSPSVTTTYTAQIEYYKCDGLVNTITDEVTIFIENGIEGVTPDDLVVCDDMSNDGFAEFDLAAQTSVIMGGMSGASVVYYTDLQDAIDEVNPITVLTFTNTVPGMQPIYGKLSDDVSGCSDILEFNLVVNPVPEITLGSDVITKVSCEDLMLDAVVANIADFSGSLTYNWYDDGTLVQSGTLDEFLLAEGSDYEGVFTLEVVVDETGCSSSIDVQIDLVGDIVAYQPDDLEACDDISNDGYVEFDLTTQDAAIANGQTNVTITYYRTPEDATAGVNPLSSTYTNEDAYVQTIYARIEDSSYGCPDITAFDLLVYNTPILLFENYYEVCSNGIDPVMLVGNNSGFELDDPGVTFAWTWNGDALTEDSNVLEIYDAGTYTVEVSTENCSSLYEILVREAGNCIIPQGISPNGDTMNQSFDLDGFNIAHISIFNRLGKEVYTKTDYKDEWHGQTDNGDELPVGTYFYVLKQDNGNTITGWVYVNRSN